MGSTDPALARWLQTALERAFPAAGWAVEMVCDSLAACADAESVQSTIDVRRVLCSALSSALTPPQSYLGASPETPAVVREYWSRRSGAAPLATQGLRQLPSRTEPPRQPQQPAKAAARGAPPPPPRGRAAKTAAAVAASLAPPVTSESDAPSWRGRVVNCLACGFVHDCRGSAAETRLSTAFLTSSACGFCGAAVPFEPDGAAAPADAAASAAAAAAAANAARLVMFDRTHAQRSVVVDDQADYIPQADEVEGNAWLSDEEKRKLKAGAAAAAAAKEEAKRRVTVTIDLLGRRVLEAAPQEPQPAETQAQLEARAEAAFRAAEMSEEGAMEGGGRHAAEARAAGEALQQLALRMAPCPTAPHTPLFSRRLDEVRALAGQGPSAAASRLQSGDEWALSAEAELGARRDGRQ